jgi:co-chaperonin GroES (HSP10)
MKPTGNSILVRPEPYERVTASGIIIPETASDPKMEWGVVVDGNGKVPDGSRVLYFGRHCFSKDGEKLVNVKKIVVWE